MVLAYTESPAHIRTLRAEPYSGYAAVAPGWSLSCKTFWFDLTAKEAHEKRILPVAPGKAWVSCLLTPA